MIKTLSFGLMHFTVAFAIVYAVTGDIVLGGLVGILEPAVNTVAYHYHEKLWDRTQQRRARRMPPRSLHTDELHA